MMKNCETIRTIQELADSYVHVSNEYWSLACDVSDFEEETEEEKEVYAIFTEWGQKLSILKNGW